LILKETGKIELKGIAKLGSLTLYVPRIRKVQSESDSMPAHASPSSFAVPYHFSISITGGFAFGHNAKTCFMLYILFCIYLTFDCRS